MPTVTTRHSFQRDMAQQALNMRLEVSKNENGTFRASVIGQPITAEGATSEDALFNVKAVIKQKFTSGDMSDIDQRMV